MSHLFTEKMPRISEATLKRLRGFAYPRRMTAESTQFDTGFEQCKRDLTAMLDQEVGASTELPPLPQYEKPKRGWWSA